MAKSEHLVKSVPEDIRCTIGRNHPSLLALKHLDPTSQIILAHNTRKKLNIHSNLTANLNNISILHVSPPCLLLERQNDMLLTNADPRKLRKMLMRPIEASSAKLLVAHLSDRTGCKAYATFRL